MGLGKYYDELMGLESCAERAKNSGLPVVVYGMGNGGEKVFSWCRENSIAVEGVFASDDFVRGQEFLGHRVERYSDIKARLGKFLVLLAFGTQLEEVMQRIDGISQEQLLLAPDVPVAGGEAFSKQGFFHRFERAERVFELLCDERSRQVFLSLIKYKLTGELGYLRESFCDEKKLFDFGSDEVCVDLGAYNGDTVLGFVRSTGGKYKEIIALEPEKRNFQKCVRNCMGLDDVRLINAAGWSHDTVLSFNGGSGRQAKLEGSGRSIIAARSVDSVLSGKGCSYIKYDVEGADIPALEGSRDTIRRFAPKLLCSVYHRCYDLIDVPLYVDSIRQGYRYRLIQERYYPAWETLLAADN